MATNTNDGVPQRYYEEPFTLENMNDEMYNGLLAIGTLATLSVVFTSGLLCFITWRMITWKSYYTSFIGRNQSLVLIYQLVLADLVQALGFVISFHWASRRAIVGPDPVCSAQGWLIQLGDVASGFFVLAIALHTCYQVTKSRSIRHACFIAGICGIWAFSLLLTVLAPIMGGRYVFLRAGPWCWISEEHEDFRLGLHYLWIFIVQFGSILVYTTGFYSIYRGRHSPSSRMIQGASSRTLQRAAMAMLAYACAYTLLTLPLAVGRMSTMSRHSMAPTFYLVAGSLFTSSGWVDALLYTLTRRSLLFEELSPGDALYHNHHNHGSSADYHRHPSSHSHSLKPGGGGSGGGGSGGSGGSGGGGGGGGGGGLYRTSSTDTILADATGLGGGGRFGGIKVDRSVDIVVMEDLEAAKGHDSSGSGGGGGDGNTSGSVSSAEVEAGMGSRSRPGACVVTTTAEATGAGATGAGRTFFS